MIGEGALEFIVPLLPYERCLVDDLKRLYDQVPVDSDSDSETQSSSYGAFWKWKWPNYIQSCLSSGLSGESLHKDHHGNRHEAYNACLHWIAHAGTEQNSLCRVEILRRMNEGFVSRLGDEAVEKIHIRPAEEDVERWRFITDVDQAFSPTWYHRDFLQRRTSGQFEIIEWAHKCALIWEYPDNAEIIDRLLVQHADFQAAFEVERQDYSEEDLEYIGARDGQLSPIKSIKRHPRSSLRPPWPEGKSMYDENGHLTKEALAFELKNLKEAATPALEDPTKYVHYIPWENLQLVNSEELTRAGISLDDPFNRDIADRRFALWSAPYPGFLWNHHLYTEDQVFNLNVQMGWLFPDHHKDSKVLYSIRVLQDTDFINTLSDYWELWNDCAISQQNSAGPVLLLETLPGQRFRSRNRRQDLLAALTYFRNLTEAYCHGSPQGTTLAHVLGLNAEDASLLKYQHSLRYIQESELHDIRWSEPLGRGANGAVYAATWHQPEPCLPTNRYQPREQAVVLKEVLPRTGSHEDPVAKVLRELDITYTGINGRTTACVQFHGVTSISRGREEPPLTLLVFERATQGHILDFLAARFETASFVESFSILIDALSSIGNGINSLHKHKVWHRDLHLGNIMVTDRHFKDDPVTHEFSYIVTDLGEGKEFSLSQGETLNVDHWASYGAVDFRAPEVHGGAGWSTKAEVFSFGVIATRILDCRRFTCKSRPPEWVLQQLQTSLPSIMTDARLQAHIVPQSFKDSLEPCLSFNPDSRQEMHPVVLLLNDASTDFFSEDPERFNKPDLPIEWTVWEWNESKARSRRQEGIIGPEGAVSTSMNTEAAEADPMDFL